MDIISVAAGAIFYVGWCVVNSMIAAAKYRNVVGVFALSLVLTPLLIWLYIAFVPELPEETE